MNDNGGTAGVNVYNAGMRGAKVTPWLGGTRASSLWRWPGTLQPADCDRLAAHIDFFPTLAELAGAQLSEKAVTQVEGRSLVPLLQNPAGSVGRPHPGYARGPLAEGREHRRLQICKVQRADRPWHLVCDRDREKQWQLFDVQKDPGETE